MIDLVYDGSYYGLLSCINHALLNNIHPDSIISETESEETLFNDKIFIPSDIGNANYIIKIVKNKLPGESERKIFFVFLSDAANKGIIIYDYIKFGIEVGANLGNFLSDNRVIKADNLFYKVNHESHRMKGLIRFNTLKDGILYSRITPDHNILPIIGYHFSKRIPNERWVIHDAKRGIAIIYDKKNWDIAQISMNYAPDITEDELFYQQLWKTYHKSISIQERVNPKLQRQCMPKRYWANLTEMED